MTLAALIVPMLIACSAQNSGSATTSGSDTIPPEFSVDSAWAYLERQVAFGPRVPGMPGHAAQLAWMDEFMRARADTVIRQPFTHTASNGRTLEMTNLFARFRPGERNRILVLAHWDTRPTADSERDATRRAQPIPGANDGASGVAVLLELANVLSRHSPPIGVDLLFVDGEDYGPDEPDMYLGAKHFAATMTGYRPLYGVLLDMIADQSPRFPIEGHSQQKAPEVVDRVWRQAEDLGFGHVFVREHGISITDDHLPLNDAGIRTIDIIDFDYAPWHTLDDDLEHVAPRGLGIVGSVLTALIYRGG